jgi:hypothetical protein
MSTAAGSIEFAHARMWARNGMRPDEALWHRIEVVRDFAAFVELTRALPAFREWVAGIGPAAGPHDIEAALRGRWRALVAEVARWMPVPWQPAVAWCASVIDIPLLQHLARGGAPPPFIEQDPVQRELARGAGGDTPDLGELAPVAGSWHRPDEFPAAWHAEWRRRLPRAARVDGAQLAALERAFAEHFRRYAEATVRDGWPLRRELQVRLLALFRRALLDPVAAFLFIALCALDLERLRGELLRRAAFPRLRLAA